MKSQNILFKTGITNPALAYVPPGARGSRRTAARTPTGTWRPPAASRTCTTSRDDTLATIVTKESLDVVQHVLRWVVTVNVGKQKQKGEGEREG